MQEALAAAYEVPVAAVRRAAMLRSSTVAAAALLHDGGLAALESVGLEVGHGGAADARGERARPGRGGRSRTGLPALVDAKLDGIRVQVHRDGDEVRVFTRSLDDITGRLPEVVNAVRALPHDRLVLDGEVLALRDDGRPEVFQAVASRTMSSLDVPAAQRRLPLQPFFFDVLHVDDHDYLDAPLHERVAVMEALLPAHQVVPRVVAEDVETVERVFGEWVGQGYEGVVVKRLDAPYAAGRRDSAWVKLKPRHTFDLVVVAVEWGSGRRQGWLSNLHLAARDPERGFVMLGKTFKGLTDETLRWQTEHFLALETGRTRHVVHVEPTTVVEIAIDGLQASTRYPGGVALRFARVLRYRPDKTAAEADLLETVRALSPVLPGRTRSSRIHGPRVCGRTHAGPGAGVWTTKRGSPAAPGDHEVSSGLPRAGGRHRTRARSASERSERQKSRTNPRAWRRGSGGALTSAGWTVRHSRVRVLAWISRPLDRADHAAS